MNNKNKGAALRSQKDAFYKAVFGSREIVTSLLKDYVPKEISQGFDYTTLKDQSSAHITRELRERYNDLIWQIQTGDRQYYIYLMLEFQSQPDYFMSVRVLSYTAALYDDLTRTKKVKKGEKLPAVLPIVIYSRKSDENAVSEVKDLIDIPSEALDPYQVSQRHIMVNVQDIERTFLDGKSDQLSCIFAYEQAKTLEEFVKAISRCNKDLKDEELKEIVKNRVFKEAQKKGYNVLIDEENNMGLVEAIDRDREITMAKGVAQGMAQGAAKMVLRF